MLGVVRPPNTAQNHKRADVYRTENLCYNKKDIDGKSMTFGIDKESNLISKKIISKVFKISN